MSDRKDFSLTSPITLSMLSFPLLSHFPWAPTSRRVSTLWIEREGERESPTIVLTQMLTLTLSRNQQKRLSDIYVLLSELWSAPRNGKRHQQASKNFCSRQFGKTTQNSWQHMHVFVYLLCSYTAVCVSMFCCSLL